MQYCVHVILIMKTVLFRPQVHLTDIDMEAEKRKQEAENRARGGATAHDEDDERPQQQSCRSQ